MFMFMHIWIFAWCKFNITVLAICMWFDSYKKQGWKANINSPRRSTHEYAKTTQMENTGMLKLGCTRSILFSDIFSFTRGLMIMQCVKGAAWTNDQNIFLMTFFLVTVFVFIQLQWLTCVYLFLNQMCSPCILSFALF